MFARAVASLALTGIGLLANGIHAREPSFDIAPLPITTAAQREQGVAGGEGFQLVMAIAYAPSNPDIVYLGSDTSQVWKSTDGGSSWRPYNKGYQSIGSRSLFVHPANENILFSAGTIGASARDVRQHKPYQGIYRSENGGGDWHMMHETEFFKQDSRGTLFAVDSRTLADEHFTIVAGSYNDGLLVSRDGGTTWSATGFSPDHILEVVERPDVPGTFLVASAEGLFQYSDEGPVKVGEGLSETPYSIAVSPDKPGLVLAAAGKQGIFKSTDGGKSFVQLLGTVPLTGTVNDVEISPANHEIAIFTKSGRRTGPYYSLNGGQHWQPADSINSRGLTEGGGFYFPSPVAMHPVDPARAITSSNGRARVLLTTDSGRHWSFSSSGYMGARQSSVISMSAEHMVFNLTDHGPWRTRDRGATFEAVQVPRKGGRSTSDGAASGDTLVVAVGTWQNKHLLVSQNQGGSWQDTGLRGEFKFIHAHSSRPDVIYAGAYRSDDRGRSWNALAHTVAAVDTDNNDRVYALAARGEKTHLLVSTNRGDEWQSAGEPVALQARRINQLITDPFRPGRLYAAAAGGVWVFDGGQWRQRAARDGMSIDAFGGTYVGTIAAHPTQPGLLFAGRRAPFKGMGNGLFYSVNHGDSWRSVDHELLTNTNVWSIDANPYSGEVFVGTAHGIYRISTSPD